MWPGVPQIFITLGPWVVPVLLVGGGALVYLAVWLISSGLQRVGFSRAWRLGAGVPLSVYLSLVWLASIGVIR